MKKKKNREASRDSPPKIEETHPLLRIFDDCRDLSTMELVLARP